MFLSLIQGMIMSSQLKPHDVTCCVIRVELFVNDSCQVFGVTFLREKRCFFWMMSHNQFA